MQTSTKIILDNPPYFGEVGIFKGSEMHTSWDGRYENNWKYPKEGIEDKIESDKLYTVRYKYSFWDYDGGLMGDSAGSEHIPCYIEETPEHICKLIADINKKKDKLNQYKSKVAKV
jgi:hypothetical protein